MGREILTSDIIVIGAGIAGLSAAAELAADARVTVLEMEPQPGYHASGRSAAYYAAAYGKKIIRDITARKSAERGSEGRRLLRI